MQWGVKPPGRELWPYMVCTVCIQALAQLPRVVVVPHPWRCLRPGWRQPELVPDVVVGNPVHGRGLEQDGL